VSDDLNQKAVKKDGFRQMFQEAINKQRIVEKSSDAE
jgi:hypothetical protein